MCAGLYSALEASVNSTRIILYIYISMLIVVIIVTIAPPPKYAQIVTRVPRLRSVTVLLRGTPSESDWLRPRFKNQVRSSDLHAARVGPLHYLANWC